MSIEALEAREDILWVQPNFSYENTEETVDDPMFAEQWALLHDGTFSLQNRQTQSTGEAFDYRPTPG